MGIEYNIRLAETYLEKGLYKAAEESIDTIKGELLHLPCNEKKRIEKRYAPFIQKYIKPEGANGCYEPNE